jgi:predicted small lipoprotein YifL
MKALAIIVALLALAACGKKADPAFPPDRLPNAATIPEVGENRGYR